MSTVYTTPPTTKAAGPDRFAIRDLASRMLTASYDPAADLLAVCSQTAHMLALMLAEHADGYGRRYAMISGLMEEAAKRRDDWPTTGDPVAWVEAISHAAYDADWDVGLLRTIAALAIAGIEAHESQVPA